MWIHSDLFKHFLRNSLAVQGLGHCTSTAGGVGSIPGQGTEIPHAARGGQKKKKKRILRWGIDPNYT